MKKKYYINYFGENFANHYSLGWSDSPNEPGGTWERITRREAINACIKERARRKEEPSSGGYANTHIYPIGDDERPEWEYSSSDGYVMESSAQFL